jgi:hypothetical protein
VGSSYISLTIISERYILKCTHKHIQVDLAEQVTVPFDESVQGRAHTGHSQHQISGGEKLQYMMQHLCGEQSEELGFTSAGQGSVVHFRGE